MPPCAALLYFIFDSFLPSSFEDGQIAEEMTQPPRCIYSAGFHATFFFLLRERHCRLWSLHAADADYLYVLFIYFFLFS